MGAKPPKVSKGCWGPGASQTQNIDDVFVDRRHVQSAPVATCTNSMVGGSLEILHWGKLGPRWGTGSALLRVFMFSCSDSQLVSTRVWLLMFKPPSDSQFLGSIIPYHNTLPYVTQQPRLRIKLTPCYVIVLPA